MTLFLHNMLTSKWIRGVVVGYPLLLEAFEIKKNEKTFYKDLVAGTLLSLNWDAFYQAADSIGESTGLPKSLAADYADDEDFLRKVHHVLLEVKVVNGNFICPETGRKFPIQNGSANMVLNEDEVAEYYNEYDPPTHR